MSALVDAPRRLPSSFRDPAGFVFSHDGVVFRQVNESYSDDYSRLMNSLYGELVGRGLLVTHEEVPEPGPTPPGVFVLRPQQIPFVSYPYEWCFSQLKDAALLTLEIQRCAIEHGMTLKDASAYNVQFVGPRPVFIDTLSFTRYVEGQPWVAYRQFCQHFLAPLALMSHSDIRLGHLLSVHIDGVPLDLASRLLPASTMVRWGMLVHIHMHARSQRRHANDGASGRSVKAVDVSRTGMLGLIDSLRAAVESLDWTPAGTEWGDYYAATNYTDESARAKADAVRELLSRVPTTNVWDLGSNTGVFSRIAAEQADRVVAWDVDPAAIEKAYRALRDSDGPLLPLVLDLRNPSPALGWANRERMSLAERGPADLVMALALVHHLAVGNNVPLVHVARYLASLSPHLLIEWVDKEDSQVQRLLATREDVFDEYTREGFERAFGTLFETVERRPIPGTRRILYLFRRRA